MAQLARDVDTGVVLIHVEAGPATVSCFLFFTLAPYNDTHEASYVFVLLVFTQS